jgi:hypothetical protein
MEAFKTDITISSETATIKEVRTIDAKENTILLFEIILALQHISKQLEEIYMSIKEE